MKDLFTCLHALFSNPADRWTWLTSFNYDLQNEPLRLALADDKGLNLVTEYLNYMLERGS